MMFIEQEWNCNMASFWNIENNREDNREINLQNTNSSVKWQNSWRVFDVGKCCIDGCI